MKTTIMLLLCLGVLTGLASAQQLGWKQNSTVYVQFSGTMQQFEQVQISTGLNRWSSSNADANNSGITYALADANHPANWTISNGVIDPDKNGNIIGARTTITSDPTTNIIISATTTINTGGQGTLIQAAKPGYDNGDGTGIFTKVIEHEVGHTEGESDAKGSNGTSVMNQIGGVNDSSGNIPDAGPTFQDNQNVDHSPLYPPPPPPPPDCEFSKVNLANTASTPPPECTPCQCFSPLVIDVRDQGFHMTSAGNGVVFDIRADGHPLQIAWTDSNYQNAFLVLDRNGDGIINDGSELFGNFTEQDPSKHQNGFLALAEFDEPDQGGNGDGQIDARDAVWSKLRLWIDANHDGRSQPEELHTLAEFGITAIGLRYHRSFQHDEFGNLFRYRGEVDWGGPAHMDNRQHDRVVWDVFFMPK